MMLPPQFDMKEVVAAAAKKGSQTYGWRTETSINAKNILQFLGTVFKRAFSLSIPRVSTKLELITRLFPGFLFDRAITDKTMLAQLNDFVKSRPEDEPFAAASYFTRERFSREGRVTCQFVLEAIMGIAADVDQGDRNALSHFTHVSFDITGMATAPAQREESIGSGITRKTSIKSSRIVLDRSPRLVNNWVKQHVDMNLVASNKRDINPQLIQSVLGPAGQNFVDFLIEKRLHPVASRLATWLKTLQHLETQGAVAMLLLAKFDDHFSRPIDYSKMDLAQIIDSAVIR